MNLVCVHLVYAGLEGRTRNFSWGGEGASFISFQWGERELITRWGLKTPWKP